MGAEAEDADHRGEGNDDQSYFGGGGTSGNLSFTKAPEQNQRPEEIELFFDTERPDVLNRPKGVVNIVMDEEERAQDIDAIDSQTSGVPEKKQNPDVDVQRRQNAHAPAKVKASETDRAVSAMLVEQKVGDEIAADDEEDEDPGVAVKDGIPKERDRMAVLNSLNGVESENQKGGDGA